MICRELLVCVISYNLLRAMIAQGDEPDRASFKGSLVRLDKWIPAIMGTGSIKGGKSRKRMIEGLLETVIEVLRSNARRDDNLAS